MSSNIIKKRRVAADGGGAKSSAADLKVHKICTTNKATTVNLRDKSSRGFFTCSMLSIFLMAVIILTNIATQISLLDFIPVVTEQNVSADNNIDTAESIDMPNDPLRIEYIHIGKTGGMTIHKSFELFRKRREVKCIVAKLRTNTDINSCNTNRANDSKIYNHTIGHYHGDGVHIGVEGMEWLLQNSNTFLYSIRDPISRIISAYNYHRNTGEHNKGFSHYKTKYKRFCDCFPSSINDMVNMLRTRRNNNNDNEKQCITLGENVLKGKTAGGGPQFQWNYNFYNDYTIKKYSNHSVAVLRTEYLWDDIKKLEQALGGSGDFKNVGFKHSHESEKIPGLVYQIQSIYAVYYTKKLIYINSSY